MRLTFLDVMDGRRGYAVVEQSELLCVNIKTMAFDEAVGKLRAKADDLLRRIETFPEANIQEFIIGKSSIKQKNRITLRFDPQNEKTWDLSCVSSRWTGTYELKNYDGLVIICLITHTSLVTSNLATEQVLISEQQYALALEQQLIHYFALEKQDSRLKNESLGPGKIAKEEKSIAGVVYIAFKLRKNLPFSTTSETPIVIQDEDTPSPINITTPDPIIILDEDT